MMRTVLLILALVLGVTSKVSQKSDWLLQGLGSNPAAASFAVRNGSTLVLQNGLVSREFTTTSGGGLCTTEYKNLVSDQTFFRAISPEANVTLSTNDPQCPSSYTTAVKVTTTNPTTAREEWNITAVTGRKFKLVFDTAVSGYQPFVSELEFKVGGVWRKNNDTSNNTIVVTSSGETASGPQGGLAYDAFDGNISTLWDAAHTSGSKYFLIIDFGVDVTFTELALTTFKSLVPGQGYYWRPKSMTVMTSSNQPSCALPFDIGGCLGQPTNQMEFWTPDDWKSALTVNPHAFKLLNYSTSKPIELFPWKAGTRHAPSDIIWPPRGVHLELAFGPPSSAPLSLAGVVVVVHYELYDGLPTFRKWISVHNDGAAAEPVVVSSLVMEMLRAPNFAPERMSVITQQANNPTPFDEQVKPETDQSFPGRTSQYWHFDPNYDQGGDQEIHVTYTYYTFLVLGYDFDTTYFDTGGANTTGPGALVSAGNSFTSLSVRLVLHDDTQAERQGLGVRQTMMQLAPQILENPLIYMITDIGGYPAPSEPMRLAVRQAAATGHELVIVGYGANGYCGLCDKQMLDPKWVAWFKAEVTYANSLGIAVSAYTLMQHNGWGEVTPEPEQALFSNGRRGGVACMATDFHARYRANVLAFINETGMAGLETDGQYEGYSCADTTGDHHHNGIAGGWSYQLQTTLDFNIALKGLSVYQTGADAYVFSGANKWNHADTDAFSHLPFWPQKTVGRMYIYDSTMNRVPASGQIGVNDLAFSSVACGAAGSVGRMMCFDYALASGYVYGTIPSFRSAKLWNPADVDATKLEATISKWVSFFKDHRAIFVGGHILHIRRPDSRDYEAIAYVRPAGANVTERALLSLLNPSKEAKLVNVTLSLYYAGFAPMSKVTITKLPISSNSSTRVWSATERQLGDIAVGVTHVVGGEGAGVFDVVVPCVLPPQSYIVYTIEEALK